MAKLVPPTTKNSPKVVTGKNPNNKPASTYAARGTQDKLHYIEGKQAIDALNPSAGTVSKGNYKPIKTDGIETRGNGAATKGRIARGPMA